MTPSIGILCLTLGTPPTEPAVNVPKWVLPDRCGTNCLYVYLKIAADMGLSNKSVTYDEVDAIIPSDPSRGCSLADLSDGAQRLGVKVEVRKLVPADFPRLRTPFIAHVDNLDRGGTGHFITVFALHEDAHQEGTVIRYIDGTDGLEHVAVLERMAPRLSGYVLARSDSRTWLTGPPVLLAALIAGGVLGALAVRRNRSSRFVKPEAP